MKKVQIIGPKGCIDECIKVLHALAIVHIETVPENLPVDDDFFTRLPMEKDKLTERDRLDKGRDLVENFMTLVSPPPSARTLKVSGEEIDGMLVELAPVEERVRQLHSMADEFTEELSLIERYERLLRGFAPIVTRLGGYKNFEIVGLTVEKTREDIAGLLSSEVGRITGDTYEIHAKELDDATIGIVLTYPKKFSPEIRFLISGKSINEMRLPDEYEDLSLVEALSAMHRRSAELPVRIKEIEAELERISAVWYARAAGLKKAIEDALDEIGILTYAAQSRFTFVIEGWVPLDMMETLRRKFAEIFGDRLLVRELEVKEEETELIPVCIKNPRILKPFEIFLSALPPPKYGSVDPTPYVALFFPTFFGLIVGDIGYGAVIFALGLILRRRYREKEFFADVFTVLSVCGLSAIVFGFLFGELFGDLGERLGILHPILLHRIEALETLLVLTFGIGIGHVTLGFIIGAVNRLYRRKTREAGVKIAYLILIASFLFIVAVIYEYLPKAMITPGVIALIIGFALLVVAEGVIGPLEFIKTLGNMLSYVRIMAVGTASVVMALVANQMGGLSDSLVVGILAATLIHLLNILLSIMSPVIQSMRLQYVEFFSKFYEGGGRKYTPFKKR